MIQLFNRDTQQVIGQISDEQFQFLVDHLEEESLEDRDYYLSADTLEWLKTRGAPTELINLLRRGLGDREGMEVRWVRA